MPSLRVRGVAEYPATAGSITYGAAMRHATPCPRGMAALAVAALVLAGCGDGGGGAAPRTSTTGGTSSPTSAPVTTVPAVIPYDRPGEPRTVGTGFLTGVSLEGSAVYAEELRPEFPELGCEGQRQPVLVRVALDTGGADLLATKALPIRGEVLHGPDARVAVVDACEGFLSRLVVGTETPDGHLRDLRQVPELSGDAVRVNPLSLSWSHDGRFLVGAANPPTGGPRVVRIDPASGAVAPVFSVPGLGPLLRVAELEGGAYAVAGGGRVELRTADGRRTSLAGGNDLSVAPDSRSVLVFGRALSHLALDGQGPTTLVSAEAGREITSAEMSPDGRAAVFVSSAHGGEDNRVRVVHLAGRRVTDVSGPGRWGRVRFSGDGRAVVLNRFFPGPRSDTELVVVRFGV